MNKLITLSFLIANFFYYNKAFAYAFQPETVKAFIDRMYNTIATRNINEIDRYFKYYADSEARFIYSLTSIDEKLSNRMDKGRSTKSRDEYIKYLQNLTNTMKQLSYRTALNSLKIAPEGLSAIVSFSVEENSISSIPNPDNIYRSIDIKILSLSNCNMILSLSANSPVISGMNCIENIVMK